MIAEQFAATEHPSHALYFRQKTLEVSKNMGDIEQEALANMKLGIAYEQIGEVTTAVRYYEESLDLFRQAGKKDEIDKACQHLVRVYQTFAQRAEEAQEHEKEVFYLSKCLEKAKECNDRAAQGQAHFKLGLAHKILNNMKLYVEHLEQYLLACVETGDKTGEAQARSVLADAHKAMENAQKSIQLLEENINLAEETNQPVKKAQACCDLGIIYNKDGNYQLAVEYFEEFFQIARQLDDPIMIDTARVYLGISRGNLKLKQFMNSSNKNEDSLRNLLGPYHFA
jgi:tetratricopeptide (TPR) repeat protein